MIKLWNYLKQKSKTIHELIKEFPNKSYRELEIYKDKYNKEHKLRQEAEGETNIVKAIGINSPEMKAAKQKIEELQNSIDRLRKENSDLYNRIANLTENQVQKARESGL
jgi:chromosome segregation ATPase